MFSQIHEVARACAFPALCVSIMFMSVYSFTHGSGLIWNCALMDTLRDYDIEFVNMR